MHGKLNIQVLCVESFLMTFHSGLLNTLNFSYGSAPGLYGQVLVVEGGFYEKIPGTFPMSDRASASQVQDGPTAGQGQAHQQ